ncbi:TAXI family TRAP transporter solute-binding subunit [Desertibaculum subflavum]|uniref:TAXI family TRAP transporter solute-binding subunit n=1 Tax=Desertibaculum subflavum TaxID=2268458 RepID=UPI0034D22162
MRSGYDPIGRRMASVACAAWLALTAPAMAQTPPQAPPAPTGTAPYDALREKTNAGTVGLISGGVEGTYVRIAADLAAVLDGPELRILPVIGKGSVQNTMDILFLRGIDIGIVQSDVLAFLKRDRTVPGVDKSVHYIAKLYNEELHLLGGKDAQKLEDLRGKKVNVDTKGSGTFMTASLVFEKLGIEVEPTHFDQALALEKLKAGEIAALVYVAGRPTRLFRDGKAEDGLHFIPIPATESLQEIYLPSTLTSADYPGLIPEGESVETLAVGAVMAAYGWAPNTERYQKVARFVDAFFSRFPQFLQAPRHAKWKEVNLAARLPGWTRFAAAENWLKTMAANDAREQRQQFGQFLNQVAPAGGGLTDQQREALFSQFLEWQKAGGAKPAGAATR